jgi:hypothetical protein
MGVLEFFEKRVKTLRNKFKEVAETVGKSGGIDTTISTLAASATTIMQDFAPIIGESVPNLDQISVNGVKKYLREGGNFITAMLESPDFDLKPLTQAVLASGKKNVGKAVVSWLSTATGATEIEAATQASDLYNKLKVRAPEGITEAEDVIEDAQFTAGGAASCDGRVARLKMAAAVSEIASSSPSSQVVYEANFNPIPGEIHLSKEDGLAVSGSFILGAAANGFGVNGARGGGNVVQYTAPVRVPNYQTHKAAGNKLGSIRTAYNGVRGLPKQTSFTYKIALDCALHFDFGAGNTAGDAGNFGASGDTNYAIFAGPSGAQVLIATGSIYYDTATRFVDVDIGLEVDGSANPIFFDFQFEGAPGTAGAFTGTLDIEALYGDHAYGVTKGGYVPKSDVTYEIVGTTGVLALGDETYLDFFGKLKPLDGNDPMTVNALWRNRISKAALVREVCGWLDTETWVNQKYISAGYAGGISDVARIDEWLDGINGPFAGKSQNSIKTALSWLLQDLESFSLGLNTSATLNVDFAVDNGFCGDSTAL